MSAAVLVQQSIQYKSNSLASMKLLLTSINTAELTLWLGGSTHSAKCSLLTFMLNTLFT